MSGDMIPSSQISFGYDRYSTEERGQSIRVEIWQNHSFTLRKEAIPVASSGKGKALSPLDNRMIYLTLGFMIRCQSVKVTTTSGQFLMRSSYL